MKSAGELRAAVRFPCVVKTSIGTASRGIWFVRDPEGLTQTLQELDASDAFADEVLVQDLIAGATEKAQGGIFARQAALAFMPISRYAAGTGGGRSDQAKVATSAGAQPSPQQSGHGSVGIGALSVDYISSRRGILSRSFIDCNPRLVEPMSACLAGLDLVELLLDLTRRKNARACYRAALPRAERISAMQAFPLGCGPRGRWTRGEIFFSECVDAVRITVLAFGRGPYADSVEELTPVRRDWIQRGAAGDMIVLAFAASTRAWRPRCRKRAGARIYFMSGKRSAY